MNYNREPGRPFTLNSKPHHHSSHITEHLREQHSTTTPTRGRKNAVWPWLARLVALFSVYRRATCQTLFHWFHFTDFISLVSVYRHYFTGFSLQTLFHWFQFTDFISLVSVYRLYFTGFSLQTLFHWFQFTDFIALVSVYRLYFTGFSLQTLLHWFQFSAFPLVRLYCIGSSLQPYHLSDFTVLVSVGSPDTGQSLFHGFSLQSCCLADLISLVSVYSPATWQI